MAEKTLFATFQNPDYVAKYYAHITYTDVWEAFISRLSRGGKRDTDYLAAAILAFGEVTGQLSDTTRYWVEKTPSNECYLDQIFAHWSNAKCIHMIRDPRARYASIKLRALRNNRRLSMSAEAYAWLCSVRLAYQGLETYGNEKYMIIRYEDLTDNSRQETKRLIGFLGISEHEALYTPTKSGGKFPWKGNSARGKHFAGLDSGYSNAWVSDLTSQEVARLETFLGHEMVRNDYLLRTSPSLSIRFQTIPGRVCNVVRTLRDRYLRH